MFISVIISYIMVITIGFKCYFKFWHSQKQWRRISVFVKVFVTLSRDCQNGIIHNNIKHKPKHKSNDKNKITSKQSYYLLVNLNTHKHKYTLQEMKTVVMAGMLEHKTMSVTHPRQILMGRLRSPVG